MIRSTSAKYELVGGYTLQLQASSDGEQLNSVTLSYQGRVMAIPTNELRQVHRPVLSAVLVSGGAMENKDIGEVAISLGFGANHCELNDCPATVIFMIKDLKYVESFLVNNRQ